MKRLFFALMMLCAGMAAQAQTIHVDHHFWDGYSLYTVKEIRMGKYFYMTTNQDDELTLEKVDGKQGEYMAYHGYRFQSKDLQEHFGKMAWYKPVDDNSTIKLDIIEQTNIQLIKSEEAERDENQTGD